MVEHVNLTAYWDTECLENFTEESFQKYCDEKLATCVKLASFIKNKIIDATWKGRVLEIGSGNSKLLYRLEQEGVLEEGTGVEISPSRHIFADKFKSYICSRKVTNINSNFLEMRVFKDMDLV